MRAETTLLPHLSKVRSSGTGKWSACCPAHNDRSPSLGIAEQPDGRILLYCRAGCETASIVGSMGLRMADLFPSAKIGREPVHTTSKAPALAAVPHSTVGKRPPSLSNYGRAIWRNTKPLRGTIGEQYLSARCCELPPADGHLRFDPARRHGPTGYVGSALVALVTDAITVEPISLHETWINAEGTKASIDPPRMLLAKHRKAGGVIRLWPDEAVTTGLAIGEGIETALSLALVYAPVWACIDAGNMAHLPVLPGIEDLLIAADHDAAGIAAARACADRWTRAGVRVHIAMAPTPRADLNDLVLEAQ